MSTQTKVKIACGFRQRSGKDTAANHLLRRHGGTRLAFAQPLYEVLAFAQDTFGLPIQKDRRFLQWVGTEWARSQDPDLLTNIAMARAEQATGNVFISDVRFPNEFKACRANGFTMVKIVRPGSPEDSHESETALAGVPDTDWDVVIHNDGTLDEFYHKLNTLFDAMFDVEVAEVADPYVC